MKIFSDISLWWLIPWAVIAVLISVFYYKNQKQLVGISNLRRYLLIVLRSAGLFLLGLMLYGILLETTQSKVEKPVFITLVDNSTSMLNYKDSGDVKLRIEEYHKHLKEKFADRFELATYSVDLDVNSEVPDYKGSVSDLDKGFLHIYNQYYNRNIMFVCGVCVNVNE